MQQLQEVDLRDKFNVFLAILRHPLASKIVRTLHARIEHIKEHGITQAEGKRTPATSRVVGRSRARSGSLGGTGTLKIATPRDVTMAIELASESIYVLQREHQLAFTPAAAQRSPSPPRELLAEDEPEDDDEEEIMLPVLGARQISDAVERFFMSRIYKESFRVDESVAEKDTQLRDSIKAHGFVCIMAIH